MSSLFLLAVLCGEVMAQEATARSSEDLTTALAILQGRNKGSAAPPEPGPILSTPPAAVAPPGAQDALRRLLDELVTELEEDEVPRRQAAPAVGPANPCLGHGWIMGSLNDPNGYGPGGAVRCHSDRDPLSIRFRNLSEDRGFLITINGMVVRPHDHGRPVVFPAADVPPELAGVAAANSGFLPLLPPGSTLYGAVPSYEGEWRLYRFRRNRITGAYLLEEACRSKAFSRHGYSVDWEEALGDNFGYCD